MGPGFESLKVHHIKKATQRVAFFMWSTPSKGVQRTRRVRPTRAENACLQEHFREAAHEPPSRGGDVVPESAPKKHDPFAGRIFCVHGFFGDENPFARRKKPVNNVAVCYNAVCNN